jgi:predicted AAA+ superfamily ATPase
MIPGPAAICAAPIESAILQRDVRELAQRIGGLADLPRLLTALAGRTATLLNAAELSSVRTYTRCRFLRCGERQG